MTVWRPAQAIRVKVLGLAWRGHELLVSEVEDSLGRVKGVRPLGGCIEFGETREQALVRELAEELGCAVTVTGEWHAFENMYEHEGATGHEYIFAANVTLADHHFMAVDRFRYLESDESDCWACWHDPLALPKDIELFPGRLAGLIQEGIIGPPA